MQFIAILANLSLGRSAAGANPGIIDEKVKTRALLADYVGEAPHLSERGKVGRQECCRATGALGLIYDLVASVEVAPMNQQPQALIG